MQFHAVAALQPSPAPLPGSRDNKHSAPTTLHLVQPWPHLSGPRQHPARVCVHLLQRLVEPVIQRLVEDVALVRQLQPLGVALLHGQVQLQGQQLLQGQVTGPCTHTQLSALLMQSTHKLLGVRPNKPRLHNELHPATPVTCMPKPPFWCISRRGFQLGSLRLQQQQLRMQQQTFMQHKQDSTKRPVI